MPRCSCGSRCNCLIEAGDGIAISGVGTSAQPYVVTADGGGGVLPDVLQLYVQGDDDDIGRMISAGASAFVLSQVIEEKPVTAGVGTVSLIPVLLGSPGEFRFTLFPTQITTDYFIVVNIFVTNMDGTEKLSTALDAQPIGVADSGSIYLMPDAVAEASAWNIITVGTDLALNGGGDESSIFVTSTDGGLYMAMMTIQFFEV